jgi:hypothetical protein
MGSKEVGKGVEVRNIRMTKEEIFKELTGLIIALNTPSLFAESQYMAQWKSKRIYVDQAIKALNKADYDWLEMHYKAWFSKEFGNLVQGLQFPSKQVHQ